MVGIDGVRHDVVVALALPNLARITARGSLRQVWLDTLPVAYTDSGPGWATVATGVGPRKHHVDGNRYAGHALAAYPDFLTRLEDARPALATYAIASWPPLTGDTRDGTFFTARIDERVFVDGDRLGWPAADEAVTAAAVARLQGGDLDAAFVYLGNPDEVAHHDGVGPTYRDAIVAADAQLGRLLDAIEARPSYPREDWLVIAVTDHGHLDEGGHGGHSWQERQAWIAATARLAAGPQPALADVAATVLAHLGVAVDPGWGLEGTAWRRH